MVPLFTSTINQAMKKQAQHQIPHLKLIKMQDIHKKPLKILKEKHKELPYRIQKLFCKYQQGEYGFEIIVPTKEKRTTIFYTKDHDRSTIFYGKNHIVVDFYKTIYEDNSDDDSHLESDDEDNWTPFVSQGFENYNLYKTRITHLYNIKTGKPLTYGNKTIHFDTFIPDTGYKKSLKNVVFWEKERLLVFVCNNAEDKKKIVLFDIETCRPVGQYTFSKTFSDDCNYNTSGCCDQPDIEIFLSKDGKKITATSGKEVYIFKNPLISINPDEPERRKYVQDHEGIKAKEETEKPFEIVINGFNGIRIPVHKSFMIN